MYRCWVFLRESRLETDSYLELRPDRCRESTLGYHLDLDCSQGLGGLGSRSGRVLLAAEDWAVCLAVLAALG